MEDDIARVLNALAGLVWTALADGQIDFVNQSWCEYTGLSVERVRGSGWQAAIHPADLPGLLERWQSILASGEPGEMEARLRCFDAAYRWFLFRANPLRNESGEIVKWYGTGIDIEDSKRGEDALRVRELSWRQIADNIPGLVATMGALGEVQFLNRQTLEYFGKTNEELKDWALIGAVHPDDLPRVIEARQQSIEAGQVYDIEHRCRRADGSYRWFQVRGLPVRNVEGTITAWYLLLTDIDDLKKAEEALQSSERNLSLTINTIPTFIQVSRPDGSLLSVNQAVLDYYGVTLPEMQKEDFRSRVYHPGDVERLREERRGPSNAPSGSNMSSARGVRTANIAGSSSATILCSTSREGSYDGTRPRSTSRTANGPKTSATEPSKRCEPSSRCSAKASSASGRSLTRRAPALASSICSGPVRRSKPTARSKRCSAGVRKSSASSRRTTS